MNARVFRNTHAQSIRITYIAFFLFVTLVVKLACSFRWVSRDNWLVVVKGRSNSF